jgi:hypothetical protein
VKRRARGWPLLLPLLVAACAQVISADFDDLKPRESPGAGGSGASGASGEGGSMGGGGSGQGGTDQGGAAGSETGGTSGSAGATGGVPNDGGLSDADAGADARDAPADRADDAHDAIAEARPDVQNDVANGPDDVHTDVPTGSVVINEMQGIGDDWLELHNPGAAPFVLDGYSVAQASGSNGPPNLADLLIFPAGTTLNAGGYLIVLGKQTTAGGPVTGCAGLATSCFTVTWGISSSAGEGMYLLYPNRSILSQVEYPAPTVDGGAPVSGQTWGRIPNGTGSFTVTAATPSAPNHQ